MPAGPTGLAGLAGLNLKTREDVRVAKYINTSGSGDADGEGPPADRGSAQ